MTITTDDITIKIKLLKSETMLAQATVILFGVWKEHGWKVLKSDRPHPKHQDCLWFQAPSYRLGSGWHEIVFIDDLELYEAVIEKIYNAYCLAKSKQPDQGEKEEEINPEDVDLESINL
ncbi:hypothetical protein HY945_03550 [Candidatus Gottesmanbacteria bacterium]|nr:hypothetical protein [Candidatus Gottesmanbacteria bacterium]